MIHQTIPISMPGSHAGARLITYIQDYTKQLAIDKRPLILLCPGGAYHDTSDRETESMALQFLAMGYHAAVLRYSTAPARFPTALTELAFSMKLLREHAVEWHIDSHKIIVQGCSAGGHLAASLGVFWDEPFLAEALELTDLQHEFIRPDGMILCYPVITTGEYCHKGSINNLIGDNDSLIEKVSLEKYVSDKTPKTFLWHTFEDSGVLMENSMLFVSALRKAGVPAEFHLYPKGVHGLALANHLTAKPGGICVEETCASWIHLAHTWIAQL